MKFLTRMMQKAVSRTADPVHLLVDPTPSGFEVTLMSGDGSGAVTLESDWDVELSAEGTSVELALAALDALCAKDWPGEVVS